jgi:hypothetical protein
MLLGTLEYMSPEQAAGQPLDHRTDQFSFGLIVYEMCTGRPAFHRETPAQVLAAVIERDPEPLRLLRPEAPEALEALVTRCLQKDPDRRFPATDTLLADTLALAGRSRAGSVAASPSAPPPLPLPAVVVRPPEAPRPSLYHVQTNEKVKRFDEQELASEIRDGKLTGLELVRYDDQEEWRPLFESRIYRREVPSLGDPRRAAQLREIRAAGGHFTGFFITSVVMYATQGHFPFWLAIWGAVLLMQLASAAPTAYDLWRRRSLPPPPDGTAAGGPAAPWPAARPAALPPPAAPVRPTALPPSPVEQEAGRVRALLEQRGGLDVSGLVAEVDRIVALTAALAARQADLAEQTTDEERSSVTRSLDEARGRLEQADSDTDRRLFERQVDVLRGREDAIAKARRVLERLRVRQEMAHHQLKQVRLDLSRDAAGALGAPELSSRLEFIRYEIDAKDEVAEIAAEARRRDG